MGKKPRARPLRPPPAHSSVLTSTPDPRMAAGPRGRRLLYPATPLLPELSHALSFKPRPLLLQATPPPPPPLRPPSQPFAPPAPPRRPTTTHPSAPKNPFFTPEKRRRTRSPPPLPRLRGGHFAPSALQERPNDLGARGACAVLSVRGPRMRVCGPPSFPARVAQF